MQQLRGDEMKRRLPSLAQPSSAASDERDCNGDGVPGSRKFDIVRPKPIPFRNVACCFCGFALMMAALNLYMNIIVNGSGPGALQLDLDHDQFFGAHHESDDVANDSRGLLDDGEDGDDEAMSTQLPSSILISQEQARGPVSRRPAVGDVLPLLGGGGGGGSAKDCMGLCPPDFDQSAASAKRPVASDQAAFVERIIAERLKSLESLFHWSKDLERRLPDEGGVTSATTVGDDRRQSRYASVATAKHFRDLWLQTVTWCSEREIFPFETNIEPVLRALREAPIRRASVPRVGTQLKAMVLLDGGQLALLKPMRYNRTDIVTGEPYAGADRHNAEIVAFHLASLLGLRRVPFVAGRRVRLAELYAVAEKALRETFVRPSTPSALKRHNENVGSVKNASLCFYGRCLYCTPTELVCGETIETAIVQWLPEKLAGGNSGAGISRVRSPWARTYKPGVLARWERDADFCRHSVFERHPILGSAPLFLDMADTALFDFLISNADRHRLELLNGTHYPLLLLIDNAKGFGDPFRDETSILAPIYQCCRLRRSTFETLKRFAAAATTASGHRDGDGEPSSSSAPAALSLAAALDRELRKDELYPLLTRLHSGAIERRLFKALTLVQLCVDRFGENVVLVNDGFS